MSNTIFQKVAGFAAYAVITDDLIERLPVHCGWIACNNEAKRWAFRSAGPWAAGEEVLSEVLPKIKQLNKISDEAEK